MELYADRHHDILQSQLFLQVHDPERRKNRQAEHAIHGFILLPPVFQGRNRPGYSKGYTGKARFQRQSVCKSCSLTFRENYTPSNREEGKVCQNCHCWQTGTPLLSFCRSSREEVLDILERKFQARLIKRIHKEMPDAVVLKTDPNYIQGFPDLLILRGKHWAAVEVKREERAPHRPNQDFWIQKLDRMSYARFIYPENEGEILHGIRNVL